MIKPIYIYSDCVWRLFYAGWPEQSRAGVIVGAKSIHFRRYIKNKLARQSDKNLFVFVSCVLFYYGACESEWKLEGKLLRSRVSCDYFVGILGCIIM